MKIENSAVQLEGLNSTSQIQGSKAGATSAHKHHHAQDQVQLSTLAQACATDPAKIDQLTAAYRAGTYNISSDKIAASMINYAFAS